MNTLVVYDSKFGNTEQLARVIAVQLRQRGPVTLTTADKAQRTDLEAVDLLVVGGPTQGHGGSLALRGWLEGLKPGHGVRAAAFDTRLAKPRWLTGSAAQVIARRLDGLGFDLVADPESFFVAHTEGPLLDGELDRAAGWADTLAGQLIARGDLPPLRIGVGSSSPVTPDGQPGPVLATRARRGDIGYARCSISGR
jgi:flavodoxin